MNPDAIMRRYARPSADTLEYVVARLSNRILGIAILIPPNHPALVLCDKGDGTPLTVLQGTDMTHANVERLQRKRVMPAETDRCLRVYHNELDPETGFSKDTVFHSPRSMTTKTFARRTAIYDNLRRYEPVVQRIVTLRKRLGYGYH